MEEGQIRSLNELEATSNFYSYGIDTMDFAVGKHLLAFTQSRAFIKMSLLLGIPKSTIIDVAFITFYKPHLDRITNEDVFKPSVDAEGVKRMISDYTDSLYRYLTLRKRSIYNLNE